MVLLNQIISGFLFYWYIIIDNWFWIIGIGVFVFITICEIRGVNDEYEDDNRQVY